MEHVAFVLQIDPARVDEYKERHQNVHPELEQVFKEVGIHRYHIFFHEGTLFAYMEVENYKHAREQLEHHPASVKWEAYMADMLLDWDNGQKSKDIPEMYRFTS